MRRILLFALIFPTTLVFTNFTRAGVGEWNNFGNNLADFNNDCVIDIVDDQQVAYRWGSYFSLPIYDTKYDNEPYFTTGAYDWDIDIKDVQFVFGRNFFLCIDFWDPETSMGMFSLKSGSETACKNAGAFNQISGSDYVDPVTVVFFANSRSDVLSNHASHHGLPHLEYDGEQRVWEIKSCGYEDVDAGSNSGGSIIPPDPWERWHLRAWVTFGLGHLTWGKFAVATPHFDDDDNDCGHFVPQIYPYDDIYPGFQGSGFDAGREWVYQRFVLEGGHGFGGSHYWGNRTPIKQGCGNNQWPSSNGNVYFIEVG